MTEECKDNTNDVQHLLVDCKRQLNDDDRGDLREMNRLSGQTVSMSKLLGIARQWQIAIRWVWMS